MCTLSTNYSLTGYGIPKWSHFTFVKPQTSISSTLIILHFLLLVVGLGGHFFSCVMVFTEEYRKKSYAIYIFALGFSDSVVLLSTAAGLINTIYFHFFGYLLITASNTFSCQLGTVIPFTFATFSSFQMCFTAIERYFILKKPMIARDLCTKRNCVILEAITLVLCFALRFDSYFHIFYDIGSRNCVIPAAFVKRHSMIAITFIGFLPFAIVLLVNILIIVNLKRSRSERYRPITVSYTHLTLPTKA